MATPSANKNNKKILIIDDDQLVLRTLDDLLRKKGYNVDTAASGSEGVEKAAKTDYGLVISDIRMPGLDGIKAVEEIQERVKKRGKKSNFLFITGYAMDDAPQHAIRLGVTDFMLKPFDIDQFLKAVEQNLSDEVVEKFPEELPRQYDPKGRWQFPHKEFVFEKLVTLKDTNMEGNVYFANYFAWQGEAREALLLSHPKFQEEFKTYQFVKMITHSSYQRFVQDSYLGYVIQVKVTSREIKKCSFILVFRFYNKLTGAFLGEGWQRIAFADIRTGKICPTPPYLLDLVGPIINEESSQKSGTKR